MNKLPWFRLYGEIIDDEKLLLLAFEDRWHYIALLACKSRGLLDKDEDPELTMRKMALKMGLSRRELDEVARRLSEVGLVDRATLQPTGWDERQFRSDTDPTAAERKRRQRERERDASRVTAVTVTRTEAEAEAEADQQQDQKPPAGKPPRKSKRQQAMDHPLPDWIDRHRWHRWIAGRKTPDAGLDLNIEKLAQWRAEGHDPNQILREAAASGWQGLFLPSSMKTNGANHGAHHPGSSKPSLVERVAANARRIIAAEQSALGLGDGHAVAADGADLRPPLDGTARRVP